MNWGQFGKAVYGGLVAFLGAIGTVLVDNASLGDLTDGQWVAAVLATVVAAGGVYYVPYVGSKP